jgi:hypothetical protein
MKLALVHGTGTNIMETEEEYTVRGAVEKAAIKEHISSGKVRSGYYNAYSYLRNLEEAGRDLRNERLLTLAMDMLNSLDHYHDELEDKYKWD